MNLISDHQGPFPVLLVFLQFPCHVFSSGRGGLGLSPWCVPQKATQMKGSLQFLASPSGGLVSNL